MLIQLICMMHTAIGVKMTLGKAESFFFGSSSGVGSHTFSLCWMKKIIMFFCTEG